MEKLKVGKRYRTHSDDLEIDFDYEVIDISNNKILYKIIENRTTLPFSNYSGIKCSNYNIETKFVINSVELI